MRVACWRFGFRVLPLVLLLLLPAAPSLAQSAGAIMGQVEDAATGEPMVGATVQIVGGPRSVATNEMGRYLLLGLAPGDYRVSVEFIGYQTVTRDVTLTGGQQAVVDFTMETQAIELDEIVAQAVVRGQARALNRQRMAATPTKVISAELMEQFGDYNLLGSLSRVPGISVNYENGDASSIRVRGVDYSKTQVTMNGIPLPGNHEGHRGTRLSMMSADMIQSLEMVDALTPEQSANSLAGTVNLRTGRVQGDEPQVRLRLGTDYSSYAEGLTPRTSLRYSQRLNDRWGVQVQGEFRRTDRFTDRHGIRWDTEEFNGVERYTIDRYEPGFQTVDRDRWGASGQVDYTLNDRHWLYLRGMFNEEREDVWTDKPRIEFSRGDWLDPTTVEDYRYNRSLEARFGERRGISNYALGGRSVLWNREAKLDYVVSYGHGFRRRENRYDYTWRYNDVGRTTLDVNDLKRPIVATPADALDPANFELNDFEHRVRPMDDRNYIAQVDLEIPMETAFDAILKFGTRFHRRDNAVDDLRYAYDWDGDGDLTLDRFTSEYEDYRSRQNDGWVFGPRIGHDAFLDFFNQNRDQFELDQDRLAEYQAGSWDTTEDVFAGYGMATLKFGDFTVLGGARVEHYSATVDAERAVYDEDGDWVENVPITASPTYTDIFPSVHVRWDVNPLTVARVSWSNAIARPELDTDGISPGATYNFEDQEIERGNPDVEPERSTKIDVKLERYLSRRVGLVSLGVFALSIDNLIIDVSEDIEGGEYDGWELTQPLNAGEDTYTWGIEATWQQQLSFLPGPLRRLGIYANYTYTASEVEIDEPVARTVPRVDLIPHVANVALSYEMGRFYGQLSSAYTSDYIIDWNDRDFGDIEFDEYQDSRFTLDASAIVRLQENVRLTFEAQNITNQPHQSRYWKPALDGTGAPNLWEELRETGPTAAVALRIDL